MGRRTPTLDFSRSPEAMRQAPRRLLSAPATVSSSADGRMACRVDNLSRAGCRIHIQCRFAVGTYFSLTFPDRQPIGCRVAWSDGLRCGLEFLTPLHVAVLDDLLALFPRPAVTEGPQPLALWQPPD